MTISNQIAIKVLPVRIKSLNQRQLLHAAARLELLFAGDGTDHAVMNFVLDQNLASVLF